MASLIPRTGEYKLATEANAEEVKEDIGFLLAWAYYWDGPKTAEVWGREPGGEWVKEGGGPIYTREEWLNESAREEWLDLLGTEQREMLADTFPPEEIPALTRDGTEG